MAVISGEDCEDAQYISMLSDGSRNIPEWKSQNLPGAPNPNSPQNSYVGRVKVNELDIHMLSNLDLDIEQGMLETPKANNDTSRVLKSENAWTAALQSKISLNVGGRFMQLLTNNGMELPKFMSRERSFDTATSRSRKYKRSASFNSRKVFLFFSALSSLGTVVLILLTLRQIGQGSANF